MAAPAPFRFFPFSLQRGDCSMCDRPSSVLFYSKTPYLRQVFSCHDCRPRTDVSGLEFRVEHDGQFSQLIQSGKWQDFAYKSPGYWSSLTLVTAYSAFFPELPLKQVVVESLKTVPTDFARIRSDLCIINNGVVVDSVKVEELSYCIVTEPLAERGDAEQVVAEDANIQLVRLEAPSLVWQDNGGLRKRAHQATTTIAELNQASIRNAAALQSALDAAAAGNATGELRDIGAIVLEGRRIADEIKSQKATEAACWPQMCTLGANTCTTNTVTPHFYLRMGFNQLTRKIPAMRRNLNHPEVTPARIETFIVHIIPAADMLQFKCENIKRTHVVSE